MKTTEIHNQVTTHRPSKHFNTASLGKQLLLLVLGTLCAAGATLNARAAGNSCVFSVNIVGCVPDMTIYLLTAPLTTVQRQVVHAQNFNQLAPSMRPLYLHAVAFSVAFGVASDGELPTRQMLGEYLQSVVLRNQVYTIPKIPAEYSQLVGAEMFIVSAALQELNVRISDHVANNNSYQQAMCAGAVHGFMWPWEGWEL